MNKGIAPQFIVDIIASEMDLPVNSVWVSDENKVIPNDNGLYVSVGLSDSQIMSSSAYLAEQTVDSVDSVVEINQVNARENIQIDIFSKSTDAKTRHWEVVAALQSFYAQQNQEKNNWKIARIPIQFLNTSSAEGGSMINRFTIAFSCLVWYRKQKTLTVLDGDYYDDFTTRVDDEQTIGTDTPLIEFEITSEGILP